MPRNGVGSGQLGRTGAEDRTRPWFDFALRHFPPGAGIVNFPPASVSLDGGVATIV